MKTRILSALLTVLLVCGLMPQVRAADTYTDVPGRHWAAADIQKVTDAGLFEGVGEELFGLGQPMTRAQFVTALVRLYLRSSADAHLRMCASSANP